ncbi:oligosaccharide flippase family protein [Rhodococcoides kroppenstedtii]|uniref:oligosaccharide flippase family protein n=1 Tax=Rhodococcoides kroppenstedtii TaxID=293050 RepID=UPI001427B020|nr:oligosaccharide flippase family protein [Rhodococcus kroppenstedtii]NIL82464.1 hypothetical protein [Rhodococcus kroppenstedtii]
MRAATTGMFAYSTVLVAARGLPVLALMYASLRLEPAAFGAVAVFVMGLTTANLIVDGGFDAAATYLLSRAATESSSEHSAQALRTIKIAISSCAVVVVALTSGNVLGFEPVPLVMVTIATVVATAFTARNSALRILARVRGSRERVSLIAEKGASSLVFTAVVILSDSARIVAIGFVVATILGCLAGASPLGKLAFGLGIPMIPGMLKSALPFIVSALAAAGVWRAATFVLAANGNLVEAGYLSLAYYPIQLLSSVPVFAAPLMLIKGSRYETDLARSIRTSVGVGMALFIVLATAALVVARFVPTRFVDQHTLIVMLILSLALPFLFLNPLLTAKLRVESRLWAPSLIHAVALILSVLAILRIVPSSGAVGAATIIVTTEIVILLGLLIITQFLQHDRSRK